ncbi:MAG: hypothetical protein KL863_15550 [Rhizobium sp.]|nr:hypothetical protein [Rhizobium sp.]
MNHHLKDAAGSSPSIDNHIPGDPGVGGMLADPMLPTGPHETPDPEAGAPSPDPEPPHRHGNWFAHSTR